MLGPVTLSVLTTHNTQSPAEAVLVLVVAVVRKVGTPDVRKVGTPGVLRVQQVELALMEVVEEAYSLSCLCQGSLALHCR